MDSDSMSSTRIKNTEPPKLDFYYFLIHKSHIIL